MLAHRFILMMIFFMVFAFFTACQGGGGGGDAVPVNTASVLTADQFAISPTRTLTSADFSGRLNDNIDFMWESQAPSSTDTCLNTKINAYKFTRNDHNTFTFSVNDIDVKECFQEPAITVNNATISIFVENALATVDAGNTVDLDNVSFDVPGVNVVQYNMKTRFHVNIAGVQTGRTADLVELQAMHAVSGFNDPCTNEGADQCRQEVVDQVHQNFAPTDYVDKIVLESHGLGVVHGAPYFAGGTMTFTLNNWSGTMTYNSSAFVAPTYTATDGVSTVTGTYTHLAPPFKAKELINDVRSSIRAMARHVTIAGKP